MGEIDIQKVISNILIKIRKRRTDLELTQDYMAFKMNISQNAYSKIELGTTRLRIDQLFVICDLLNIKVEKLFASVDR